MTHSNATPPATDDNDDSDIVRTSDDAHPSRDGLPRIWPTIVYDDAPAAIAFLCDAFGCSVSLVVPNDQDPAVIEHAQLRFPDGGGVMLGSSSRPSNPFSSRPTGSSGAYVVTHDVDRLYERSVDAGAEIFQPLNEEEYGSRGFSVLDPEGNLWSFGTYGGES